MTTLDVLSPDIYVDGVPHARFAQLRREAPVAWHPEPNGGPGFWAVTKHADVLAVSLDAKTFSSESGGTQIEDLPRGDLRVSPDNLAIMDPPRHSRFRALVASAFTPAGLAAMEPFIVRLVGERLDALVDRGRFDFMSEFAARLPMAIILRMVGVPAEDEAKLGRWIARLLAPDDPEFASSPEERAKITGEFMGYAHTIAAARRKTPEDDLLSRLMSATVDGVSLSYEEFGMFFMLLLAAGTHTTQLSIGNATKLLIEHPDARRAVASDPSLVASTIEEVLRFSPPLMHFRRTAKVDTELRGVRIAAGQKVVVWYPSANRDEEVFSAPDTFDVRRTPNEHVSFGHGPHSCLGHALARMQLRIAVAACLSRLPALALDGPVERLRSNWFNGMKSMPVRVV